MTCNWWAEDDDSKLGGMCWYWDDCRDCSGSKDNTCYNIVEKRRRGDMIFDVFNQCYKCDGGSLFVWCWM